MESKKCSKCGEDKEFKCFYSDKSHNDSLSSSCGQCQRSRNATKKLSVKIVPPNKTCPDCNINKMVPEFNKSAHSKDGLAPICRDCSRIRQKEYVEREIPKSPDLKWCRLCDTIKPKIEFYVNRNHSTGRNNYCKGCSRNLNFKREYGISLEEYDDMLFKQSGQCLICGDSQNLNVIDYRSGKNRRLAVDHCHKTGKVRGLLCDWCNRALGFLRDDPELFEKAAEYLRESKK